MARVKPPYPHREAGLLQDQVGACTRADGLNRDERIYNIMDTTKVLGRGPRVAITDKSGTPAIVHWVNEFLGTKNTPDQVGLKKAVNIQKWVLDQYTVQGRLTAISDQELEGKVKEHLPELYAKFKG